MTETRNVHAAVGAALGLLGVGLGAFGAHGLEDFMQSAADSADRIEWWATATDYHLVHAVAMVALAIGLAGRRGAGATAWCLGLGIAIFSGTLYAMALGAPRWFGAITPIGGVLLMVGWFVAALAFLRRDVRA